MEKHAPQHAPQLHPDRLALLGWTAGSVPKAALDDRHLLAFLRAEPVDATDLYLGLTGLGKAASMLAIQQSHPELVPVLFDQLLKPEGKRMPPPVGLHLDLEMEGDAEQVSEVLSICHAHRYVLRRLTLTVVCVDLHAVEPVFASLGKAPSNCMVEVSHYSRQTRAAERSKVCLAVIEAAARNPRIKRFHLIAKGEVDLFDQPAARELLARLLATTSHLGLCLQARALVEACDVITTHAHPGLTSLALHLWAPAAPPDSDSEVDVGALWDPNWAHRLSALLDGQQGLCRLEYPGPVDAPVALPFEHALNIFIKHRGLRKMKFGGEMPWSMLDCVIRACLERNGRTQAQVVAAAAATLAQVLLAPHWREPTDTDDTAFAKWRDLAHERLGPFIAAIANRDASTANGVLRTNLATVSKARQKWRSLVLDDELDNVFMGAIKWRLVADINGYDGDLLDADQWICCDLFRGLRLLAAGLAGRFGKDATTPHAQVLALLTAKLFELGRVRPHPSSGNDAPQGPLAFVADWLGPAFLTMVPGPVALPRVFDDGATLLFEKLLLDVAVWLRGLRRYLKSTEPDASDAEVVKMLEALRDDLFEAVIKPYVEAAYRRIFGAG